MVPTSNTEVIPPPSTLPLLPLLSPAIPVGESLSDPGNTGTTNEQVLPVLPMPVIPVNHGIPAVNAVLPDAGNTGNTYVDAAETPMYRDEIVAPVIPVIPGTGSGMTDGITDELTTGVPTPKVKEETLGRSFKLPLSTIQSMERAIAEINSAMPPQEQVSFHGYGVDILANHDAYRRAAQQQNSVKTAYENEQKASAELSEKLALECQRSTQLAAQLKQATDYIARLSAASDQASFAPVLREKEEYSSQQIDAFYQLTNPPSIPAESDKYERLATEYQNLQVRFQQSEKLRLELQNFAVQLPSVLAELYAEASRLTWLKPSYFKWYFEFFVQRILPK